VQSKSNGEQKNMQNAKYKTKAKRKKKRQKNTISNNKKNASLDNCEQ